MRKSVCVVGGGASGMTAALAASRAGAKVTLLEHRERVGKKILLTGNGKCNLTNLHMNPSAYGETADSLVGQVLAQFDQQDLMDFLHSLGMRLTVNRESYVYPETEAAATVVNVFRRALAQNGVSCETETEIKNIGRDNGFTIDTNRGIFRADCLILACGGKSYPKTGSDGSGYKLAEKLGVKVNRDYPALTAFVCKKDGLKAVAGLRANAKVTLYIDEKPAASDEGQVQFTDYGISGIPVFQVSILASRALLERKRVRAKVNLFPELTKEEVRDALRVQVGQFAKLPFEEAMTGFLHKKWIDYFGKQYELHRFQNAGSIPKQTLEMLAEELCALSFPVEQVKGYDFCQVTGGGVDLAEVDTHLQSVKIPGLYLVGEMLDAVGKCGGYNLQWAFSTGYIAGNHAAKENGPECRGLQRNKKG